MSKRDLKKFLNDLDKEQLEEQVGLLYDKFKDVKVFYDFVFNPNENKRINDAKSKIYNEYFPINRKKPKMRRAVAQKFIKHFIVLGVDPFLIADLMLFQIEIAQTLSSERQINSDAFYKGILISFNQVISFLITNTIFSDFHDRVVAIHSKTLVQDWKNSDDFEAILNRILY